MKQKKINQKRRKLCSDILGLPVRSAFMNQNIPNGIALAWTGEKDAYLVNLSKKTAKIYVKSGRFLMKRAILPVKIWVEKIDPPESLYDLEYLGDELEERITKSFQKDHYFD
jgi:hypothetical protein